MQEHQKTGSFKEVTTEQFEGDPANNPLGIDVRDATQFWTLSVTDVDADGFKVTATGKAGTDYEDTEVILDYSRSGDETWTIS